MQINSVSAANFGNFYNETRVRNIFNEFIPQNRHVLGSDSFEKHDIVLDTALEKLKELEFSKEDINKVRRFGAKPMFLSGKEALDFAKKEKIPIVFGEVDQPDIHAQWINDKRTIVINEAYRNNKEPAIVYAISSAILHELGHAKDGDGVSSIQEEIDCLSMNALAFNEFKKKNSELFKKTDLPIIKDGVELYTNLFMGNDKKALEERIRLKYGTLPVGSPNHKPKRFAHKVAEFV